MKPETEQSIIQVTENNHIFYLNAISFAQEWCKSIMRPFTSEDLKESFYEAKNEYPREPRVWGSVIKELSKMGVIFRNGFAGSRNPVCHDRPMTQWISKEYRLKQQTNAIKDKSQIKLL